MNRLCIALVLVAAPFAPLDAGPIVSPDGFTSWPATAASAMRWRLASASAQEADPSAKEAFEAAKELGTVEAWNAFLARYEKGFYGDLARAYLKKLADTAGTPSAPVETPVTPAAAPSDPAAPESPAAAPSSTASAESGAGLAPTDPTQPAVGRGGQFLGFPEQFNRYYTDPAWKPSSIVYVGPSGSGDGATRDTPMPVQAAIAAARPGTEIYFIRGKYQGCFEIAKENSGSYDEPVVLYAERNPDKSLGVAVAACSSGRQTSFNLEQADYIALDGFELVGGRYGVRTVGAGYPASQHARGVAVIDVKGHDQNNDPFFSGQVDWAVWERNVAYGAKAADGHGFYLSNGGDWNIVRYNETYGNVSSDFQINADPNSTCKEVDVPFADTRCDAYAGEGEGGQGASDYFLVDANFFHHGKGPGANFTSMRRSVVRNNIFGFQAKHNVSFWQETDNPKLGSSDNRIVHNLFVTTGQQGVQFVANSTRNEFANNIVLGVQVSGGTIAANPSATLMEVDDTVGANVYRSNLYVGGKIDGRQPNDTEKAQAEFSPGWFANFPKAVDHDPNDFRPSAEAPFLAMGTLSADAPADRNGTGRSGQVDLGPIEVP